MAALEPVVEQDAGHLPSLARAGAIPQKPAAAKANGILSIVTRSCNDVERRIDRPGPREKLRMRFASRAIDMDRCREWRVHQDNTRNDARIEVIVDVCGIKSR